MILDIVLVISVLIGLGLGIWKGISGLLLGFFSIVLSLIISFFLADIVAAQLYDTSLGTTINESIIEKVNSFENFSGLANAPIYYDETTEGYYLVTEEGNKTLTEALSAFPASGIIEKYAINILDSSEIDGMTLTDKFVPSITMIILSIGSGFALFIILAISFRILRGLTEHWDDNETFSKVNKIIGCVVTLIIVFMFANAVMLCAKFAPNYGPFETLAEMKDSSILNKLLYNHNILEEILKSAGIDPAEMLGKYFPSE